MSNILVSGVLVNPFNRPLPNAIITLTSISNSFTVLTGANVTSRTNDAGEYEFHLQPGNYAVYVAKDSYRDFYGAITTTATTPPTTLNVLLKQNAMEAELPPDLVEFFQQVQNQVVVVGNGADEAARIASEKAKEAALSEQNSGAYSDAAGQAASSAGSSAATAEEIANKLGDLEQLIRDAGYAPVDSFEQGYILTSIGQALRQESSGVFYSWRGEYPKVVPPGSTPETTGGISRTAWVDVNDLTLRGQISSEDGVSIVGNATDRRQLSFVTASSFGFTGIGNEASLGLQFLDYCSQKNMSAIFDIDVNLDGMVFKGNNVNISGPGKIKGWWYIKGDIIANQIDPVTIGIAGDWTQFPIGTTTFSGNFSKYKAGDNIMLSLNGSGSSGTTQTGELNQIGVHFSTVVSATAAQVVIAHPTRFKFDTIKFTRFTGRKYLGSVSAGTFVLNGDFSWLQEDQMIRIENIDASDGFQNSKFYFEYTRVKYATSTQLILTDALFNDHSNPWVVAADFCKNINIDNANISTLQTVAVDGSTVTNVRANRLVNDYLYDFNHNILRLKGNTPNLVNWTFPRNGVIRSITAEGATGNTDNACAKMMSPVNVDFDGLAATDYGISGGVQSINGFFVDALFTPYRNWGSINASGIRAAKSRGGLGVWFVGVKRLNISNISASSHSRIFQCMNVFGDIECSEGFFSSDNEYVELKVNAKYMQTTGDKHAVFSGAVKGTNGDNDNRCIIVAGSSRNSIAQDIYLDGLRCLSTDPNDTFIHAQNVTDFVATNCRDFVGLANSVTFGSNLAGEITIDNHRLRNPIANSGTRSGGLSSEAMIKIGAGGGNTSAWDRNHLVLGNTHVYPEGGRLKMNIGQPTAEGQGYYLSRRVEVPIAQNAGGQVGDWASGNGYLYVVQSANLWKRYKGEDF
ncbi:prophage tail fiber N-terminal domain-containing protein [Serratia fonticola]|uniref:prophage tail fiber N-terminal domain-containing protein n=1 Tax=Serratia fonticola TaxID=47917 RepID=UPI00217B2FAE|nr:prophage tail fiber N-terminal domain-containing protein [Serratia fonticola]CAI1015365.1 Prophage tail fibre N-terminal [Serratia fonticola]